MIQLAQHLSAQSPLRTHWIPGDQRPLAGTDREEGCGIGGAVTILHTPNPQPGFGSRQGTDWEKVRGGVEGGGKKFKEGRLGGIASPHPSNQSLARGGCGRSEKAREDGVIRGAPGANSPET